MKKRQPKVVPDVDVRLSDMTNLTRAKDAVVCSIETEGRRQRGRHSPSEGRLCVKTDSWLRTPGYPIDLHKTKGESNE
jgi:hypothetical protein